mgnify:CR=1 FL=1
MGARTPTVSGSLANHFGGPKQERRVARDRETRPVAV